MQIFIILALSTMKTYLKDISETFTGFTFREKVEHNPEGNLHVIQAKDLENFTAINFNTVFKTGELKISSRMLLEKGDVLFLSKGANNFASIYNGEFEKAIASSAFIIIRPDKAKIIPAYLQWYINAPQAQEFLHTGKEGTFITNITLLTLQNLEVNVPPLEMQKQIASLNELAKAEKKIMKKIIEKKEILTNQLLNNIIK